MNSGPWRLPSGGRIDRTSRVDFAFDGRALVGHRGDTLASALLANGCRVVGRSFKFRRPRGVFSSGSEEPNALVRLGEGAHAEPSARATMALLGGGLVAHSQSGWPSVGFDLLRALDLAPRLLAAGFYNKTFMWPGWHTWEPLIRRLAGLGVAPTAPDPERYEHRHLHCDVLVVGGGRSGLRAATNAARAGLDVVLVEARDVLGGRGLSEPDTAALIAAARDAGVEALTSTTAAAIHGHGVVTLLQRCSSAGTRSGVRERYWIVRPGRIVLATGAIEQPLVFANNDRPGVMLAGAALEYLIRFGVAAGREVVVATNDDSAYSTAVALHDAGVAVLAVADSRANVPSSAARLLAERSIPLLAGHLPVDTSGRGALRSVTVAPTTDSARRASRRIDADALLVCGGWTPALSLFTQAGGRLRYEPTRRALVPTGPVDGLELVGRCAGAGVSAACGPRLAPSGDPWRQFVDLRHDVTVGDLELAIRENYRAIEHVKRYTTVGMSVDQGKTSNVAAIEIVAAATQIDPASLGHTTMRPPVTPVTLGAIAGPLRGPLYAPHRVTPLHAWNLAQGAHLRDYGEWRRVACYPRAGESEEEAVAREVRAVRTGVAMFDASPLGKIEVHGPDARTFLDRFYVNRIDTLKPGVARYGLMLRETGAIFDDGTVTALDEHRFLVTTTSGNAGRVAAWLDEWHQCDWPELRVAIVPVTEQWATIAVAGVHARDVLAPLFTDGLLAPDAFPHFGVCETTVLGRPARVYRVSFSGELCYEVNVPASAGGELAEAIRAGGERFGICPYGTEAVLRLRLEKGYLHVGTDTDATTVPADVGWGRIADAKPNDYVGRRSLSLPDHLRPDRRHLVGLRATFALPVGAHLRRTDSTSPTDGWITSAGTDSTDGSAIALALLSGGRGLEGQTVTVHDRGRIIGRADVVKPVFYDPENRRMTA